MSKMLRTEFVMLMAKLRSAYQNAIQDEDMWTMSSATYWDGLCNYDAGRIRAAFEVAPRVYRQWMPSLGQMVELIEGGGRSAKLAALDAWVEAKAIASGNGKRHTDPVARRTIAAMGGAKRMGRMTPKELDTWGRKEFESIYAEMVEQERRGVTTRPEFAELDGRVQKLIKGAVDG